MKTDPNVMEIFFRPPDNFRAHRGSESFDSCRGWAWRSPRLSSD